MLGQPRSDKTERMSMNFIRALSINIKVKMAESALRGILNQSQDFDQH